MLFSEMNLDQLRKKRADLAAERSGLETRLAALKKQTESGVVGERIAKARELAYRELRNVEARVIALRTELAKRVQDEQESQNSCKLALLRNLLTRKFGEEVTGRLFDEVYAQHDEIRARKRTA